ncbi:T9SS type A sorting domain-containing protein [Lacinutrix cladophorae]
MKKLLLLFAVFIFNAVQAQTVIIPNGDFSQGIFNWTVTGNNLSLATIGSAPDEYLRIINSGVTNQIFTLKSSNFSLLTNEIYNLDLIYAHYFIALGPMGQGVSYSDRSLVSSIILKDINNNIIKDFDLSACDDGDLMYETNYELYDQNCNSSTFNVSNSGSYYIEVIGSLDQTFQHPWSDEYDADVFKFKKIELVKNQDPSIITGTVNYDHGNNNCASGSVPLDNILIKTTGTSNTYYASTNSNGDYAFAFNGNGNVTTEVCTQGLTSLPINHVNTFVSGVPSTVSNQDFCATSAIVGNDLSIFLIPTSEARPGFSSSYRLQYTNTGSTILSGVVDLNYDNSSVTYLNATSTPDVTTISSLSWNFINLAPFETRTIDVTFNIFTPPTVNNGDILEYTASITPIAGDDTPTNNTYTFNQITIGSYDPNDVTILEGPLISETQADDYLGVIIRFQNTGTASAINITVENTLDAFLDWSTFQPIAASHNYNTIISNGNEINFVFNNINLADSTTDEPGSHGWVFYRIKPKSTFVIGDIISNKADIYFDYNLPIITNTATTQIESTLSIHEIDASESLFTVFPNPTKTKITVSIEIEGTYNMVSVNGQVVKEGLLQKGENTLNTSNLSNGLYFLQVETVEGVTTKKIVKQ